MKKPHINKNTLGGDFSLKFIKELKSANMLEAEVFKLCNHAILQCSGYSAHFKPRKAGLRFE